MEKENPPLDVPPAGRFPPLPSPPQSVAFNNDLSRMPENPPKSIGHRRAHSEILGDGAGGVGMSFSDDTGEDVLMYMDKVNLATSPGFTVGETSSEQVIGGGRHQHSQSLDGLMTIGSEMFAGGSEVSGGLSASEARNAMFEARYAELALVDPKRAKRLLSNKQYATRHRERTKTYVAELVRKVQSLQTETTTLSSQLTALHKDTNDLISANKELKIRLQAIEKQGLLQDALNDAMRKEIQHLKTLTDQATSNGVSFGANQNSQVTQNTQLTAQQFQQLHLHSQSYQPHLQQFRQQYPTHQNQIPPSMPPSKDNSSNSKSRRS